MKIMTNYNHPSREQLTNLINEEASLVQLEEMLKDFGDFEQLSVVRKERNLVNNRKKCMKAAIELNEKRSAIRLKDIEEVHINAI